MQVKHFYLHLFLISALVWSPCYGTDPCMIKLDLNSDANTRNPLKTTDVLSHSQRMF
jgi:hypothetical protein